MAVHLGRSITGNRHLSFQREWLVTNGLGGYAMGTVAGARTRRYHGLLVAAITPPTQRILTVAAIDTWAELQGKRVPLTTHQWDAGIILPDGYNNLENFRLEGLFPVSRWTIGNTCIEKRIWMEHGANTTYITWHHQRGTAPIKLILKPLITYRMHHDITKGGARITLTTMPTPWQTGVGIDILPSEYLGLEFNAPVPIPFRILTDRGSIDMKSDWWWAFHLAKEKERGVNASEDLFQAGTITVILEPGETVGMVCTTAQSAPDPWPTALERETQRQAELLERAKFENAPDWIQQLILAADQFIIEVPGEFRTETYIISGYPWFGVWGRDSMVSLTGLTSVIGRGNMAAEVLRTLARYIDKGMVPNNLSDINGAAAYNSIDASLWFLVALWAYQRDYAKDKALLKTLYPLLKDMINWHINGTRYHIEEDPNDGLLFGGESGTQLTWMDAKINDWVVTPRIGKDVDVNALWYNALRIMELFAQQLDHETDSKFYRDKADRVRISFNKRFWCEPKKYLYDVIDIPNVADDSTLRPNQLLALSLPFPVLTDPDRARHVVDVCARQLLTSYGLRTLNQEDVQYIGNYAGSLHERDIAYHQGTVWAWLIGPFVSAYLNVYQDPEIARSFLEPFADHLLDHGLGTISEVFDGNAPFRPHGAIAQAWSVAEVLRVWRDIERHIQEQ